ncbi:MAG TPA: fibronectin type III domain-containing protein [Herpetosiphonaceae bacterium]
MPPSMRSPRRAILLVSLLATLVTLAAPGGSRLRAAEPIRPASAPPRQVPPNDPVRGLIYDGLEPGAGACAGLFAITGTDRCTHGPDPYPPGVGRLSEPAAPGAGAPWAVAGAADPLANNRCPDDGETGRRIQVLYARAADVPDRFEAVKEPLRSIVAGADEIYALSAADTGGSRNLRLVREAVGDTCLVKITPVELSEQGDDSFGSTIMELQRKGFNRRDRKYLIYMDARLICGIGTMYQEPRPDLVNPNNQGPSYARVDAQCWAPRPSAHELGHTLGAVQDTAPHTTSYGHCVDEYDLLCYSDAPTYPTMIVLCPDETLNSRLDCGHDDYFHTAPAPGSYLATHWNSADNMFLIGAPLAPPLSPLNLQINDPGPDTLTLAWSDGDEETGYKLRRSTDGGATWADLAALPADAMTFRHSGLACERLVYYQLTAINAAGESPPAQAAGQTTRCALSRMSWLPLLAGAP